MLKELDSIWEIMRYYVVENTGSAETEYIKMGWVLQQLRHIYMHDASEEDVQEAIEAVKEGPR